MAHDFFRVFRVQFEVLSQTFLLGMQVCNNRLSTCDQFLQWASLDIIFKTFGTGIPLYPEESGKCLWNRKKIEK